MQYMLLIYDNEKNQLPQDERNKMFQEYGAFTQGIIKSGTFQAGAPLQPTSTATTVRVRNGKTLTVDGPGPRQLRLPQRLIVPGSKIPSIALDAPLKLRIHRGCAARSYHFLNAA